MTEHYIPPAYTDKNGVRLIEGDVVIYKDTGYVYKGIAEPLGLACIDGGVNGDEFVKPEELEVVT
jgi:hypothetical protein